MLDDSNASRALVARPHCAAQHFYAPLLPDAAAAASAASAAAAARGAAASSRPAATASGAVSTEYTCAEGRPLLVAEGCDAGYWGAGGPCCKASHAFRHLAVHREALLDPIPAAAPPPARHLANASGSGLSSGRGSIGSISISSSSSGRGGLRWFVFADDDSYFVPSPLRRFLEGCAPFCFLCTR